MSDTTESPSRFNMQIGPAAILSFLQIVGIAAGGIWFLSNMTAKFDEAEHKIAAVHTDVRDLNDKASTVSSRVTGVETAVGYLKDAVNRIDTKIK